MQNSTSWMLSFGDLLSLMLMFFVMIYLISDFDTSSHSQQPNDVIYGIDSSHEDISYAYINVARALAKSCINHRNYESYILLTSTVECLFKEPSTLELQEYSIDAIYEAYDLFKLTYRNISKAEVLVYIDDFTNPDTLTKAVEMSCKIATMLNNYSGGKDKIGCYVANSANNTNPIYQINIALYTW